MFNPCEHVIHAWAGLDIANSFVSRITLYFRATQTRACPYDLYHSTHFLDPGAVPGSFSSNLFSLVLCISALPTYLAGCLHHTVYPPCPLPASQMVVLFLVLLLALLDFLGRRARIECLCL